MISQKHTSSLFENSESDSYDANDMKENVNDLVRFIYLFHLFYFIYSFFNVDNYRTNTVYNKKIAIKC